MINWLRGLFIQPPAYLIAAKRKVDAENTYLYYLSTTQTLRHGSAQTVIVLKSNKPKGSPANAKNCVDFALAYQAAVGRGSLYNKATLKTGEMHCVLHVDGWELDNFARSPRWIGK